MPLLFIACQNGNLKIVKILIEHGADVNKTKASNNSTPILTAAQSGYLKIVELLIEYGADINKINSHGFTPLILAIDEENFEVVKVLLKSGADINIVGDRGRTALFFAINQENQELIKFLIDKGANVNHIDNIGYTPLDIANKIGCIEIYNGKGKEQYIKCKNRIRNIAKFLISKGVIIGPITKEKEDTQQKIKKNSKYDIDTKDYKKKFYDNSSKSYYSCSWHLNCHDRHLGAGIINPKSIPYNPAQ